jgi:hypothetical protein
MGVEGSYGEGVEQFDASYRHTRLYCGYDGFDRTFDAVEGAGSCRYVFRDTEEPNGNFGQNAKRPQSRPTAGLDRSLRRTFVLGCRCG